MNTQDWSPLGWGWISLSKGFSRVFSNTAVQKHQFFNAQLSAQPNSHIHTWLLEKPQPWLDRLLDETSLVAQRVKASAYSAGDLGLIPGWGKTPWRRKWQPTPLFLSGKSHRQRSLAGYSPWAGKELDTTDPLHFTWLDGTLLAKYVSAF